MGLIDTDVSKAVLYTGNKSFHEAPTIIKNTFLQRLNYSTLKHKRFKLSYTKLINNIIKETEKSTKQYHKQKNITQEQQLKQLIDKQNDIQDALNDDPNNTNLHDANEQAKKIVQDT